MAPGLFAIGGATSIGFTPRNNSAAGFSSGRNLAKAEADGRNGRMPDQPDITDTRTPSPPYGYSRECHYSRDRQIHIVAEYHANRIRPSRIAYRVGIDIAFIEALIAGEEEPELFPRLVALYRQQRYQQRMRDAISLHGGRRFEQQQRIEREYRQEREL
jgi:hypothetical protein